jgi:two-component system, chemotaxis family, protein-glutamate methylesterase/glutaminase
MHPDFASHKRELIRAVKSVARVPLARRFDLSHPSFRDESAIAPSPLTLVGIGASTGGPAAVMELLRSLPSDFAPSIAVVQHITPGFVVGMVDWLASGCELQVELAAPGMRLPWHGVRVAPDGVHLKIVDGAAELDSGPPRGGSRPSVNVLFESMADWSPRSCAGILMSGMGRDGCAGLARMRKLGARTMVQSEETCAVFGMPGAALEMGAAEVSLAPTELAAALQAMVRAS